VQRGSALLENRNVIPCGSRAPCGGILRSIFKMHQTPNLFPEPRTAHFESQWYMTHRGTRDNRLQQGVMTVTALTTGSGNGNGACIEIGTRRSHIVTLSNPRESGHNRSNGEVARLILVCSLVEKRSCTITCSLPGRYEPSRGPCYLGSYQPELSGKPSAQRALNFHLCLVFHVWGRNLQDILIEIYEFLTRLSLWR
jgi:hypothetical protein